MNFHQVRISILTPRHLNSQISKMFPTIDGHFWVVRDGAIIDPHFKEYDAICAVHKCDPKSPKSYLPASPEIQEYILSSYEKVLRKWIGITKQETFLELCEIFKLETASVMGSIKPLAYKCYQNCLIEIAERGGELVFGSLGFKYKNADGYWYEFGGNNWEMDHFLRNKPAPAQVAPAAAPVVKKQKPNEQCLCGSGKKYKKCCGCN